MEDLSQVATGDDAPGAANTDGDDAKPYFVRVLDAKGHASRREVWIGVSNRVSAEVLKGLEPGEVVVVGRQEGQAAEAGTRGNRSSMGRLF